MATLIYLLQTDERPVINENDKVLYLMRHAKAEPYTLFDTDFERKLLPLGEAEAEEVALVLKTLAPLPTVIVASAAQRTLETAEILEDVLESEVMEMIPTTLLYNAEVSDYLEVIASQQEQEQAVLVLGHNPSISALIGELSGSPADLPTAACACILFKEANWESIPDTRGTLLYTIQPGELS
jgi:phosphohistidine phosphatase